MSVTTQRPIVVWSVPRSTSTAFERAFIQRDDTEVLHEPFGEPYYYGPERLSERYSEAQREASIAKNLTFSDIHKLIIDTQEKAFGKLVVSKDMANYIVRPEMISSSPNNNPTVLSDEDLKKFRHTFLIRSPEKSIPSYYRATLGDCGGFGEFHPDDAGFKESRALLDYIKCLLPDDPVVLLDSADLIAQPEKSLRAFCRGIGIDFQPSMLSWEKKHVASFDKWKGFHEQAQDSTGFQEVSHTAIPLPQKVTDAIDNNMPTYEYLQDFKLKI